MLNSQEILTAIQNKEIEITVSYGIKNGIPFRYDTERSLLKSEAATNLYSDRLKITMGPLVKVLDKKGVSKKHRFKSNDRIFDLSTSGHKYIIRPSESIIVLTNERIKLSGKYACLVVPRISLSDVGIVVTTAYVDPYYDGLMRLHISNLSDKTYELKTLEAIAQCFFFEFSTPVSNKFKEQFSSKSVFWGQTWNGINGTDRNPFPTKKSSTQEEKFSYFKYQCALIWEFIKKHSILFMIITNIFVLAAGFSTVKQSFEEYSTAVNQISTSLEPMTSEILIHAGCDYGEKEITVDIPKSDIVSILCNNDDIHYQVLSGVAPDVSIIRFSCSLDNPSENSYEFGFTYAIIRRIAS